MCAKFRENQRKTVEVASWKKFDDTQTHYVFYERINGLMDGHKTYRQTESAYHYTTLWPKKVSHLMFDNNFGKCGPIFKILLPGDS